MSWIVSVHDAKRTHLAPTGRQSRTESHARQPICEQFIDRTRIVPAPKLPKCPDCLATLASKARARRWVGS
jgi:hypothetical protein